jgi:hypothetical protein
MVWAFVSFLTGPISGAILCLSKTEVIQSEFIMSARNGDKSRFGRNRKRKIARRLRTQELLKNAESKSANTSARVQPRSAKA